MGGGAAADGAEGALAAYTPNFKYKVLKEEKELPEWARPFVTSADMEKQFRDVFERADGIETVKQHRDELVQTVSQMREQWQPVVQNTQMALEHVQRKDLDSFFELVGIPEVDVLKYALKRLQLRENPAALAQHEGERRLATENAELQRRLTATENGYQSIAVQTAEFQLDNQLSRAETQGAVQAFDARVGKPGAFRAEVIRRGQAYAAAGQDISIEQAVSEVLQLIGWQGQNPLAAPGANGQGANAPAAGGGTPQADKQVLPHLKGKGGSPVKAVPKSTAGLRELGKQMRQ